MNRMLPRPRFWAETALQMRTRFSLMGELAAFLLVYLISSMAQGFLASVPITAWMMGTRGESIMAAVTAGQSAQTLILKLMEQMPDWFTLVMLLSSAVIGAAALIYVRKFQKRSLRSMGLRGKALPEALPGLLVGLGLVCAALALGSAIGGFRLLTESRPDGSRVLWVLAALLCCLVRGAALELLLRGYFTPSLGGRYPVGLALGVSTVLSATLESGGSLLSLSGLNSLLLALLLGIWVIKRGNLWGACAMHGAWLFALGFLFGFAPAGSAHEGIRLLDVDVNVYRSGITGGVYGPEASPCVTLVLLAALAAALALRPRDPAPIPQAPADERPGNFL